MNFTSNFIYVALKKLTCFTTPAAKLTPKKISLTSVTHKGPVFSKIATEKQPK